MINSKAKKTTNQLKKNPNKKEPTMPTKRRLQLLLLRYTIKPENLIKPEVTVTALNEQGAPYLLKHLAIRSIPCKWIFQWCPTCHFA